MSEYLVDIKDERLSFFTPAGEVKALGGVSIHLKEGEVLGIVGESGSGKSVTAYSLMGLTAYPGRLVGGKIWFNGHQIDQMTEKEFRKIRGTLDFNGHHINDMSEKEMRRIRGNEVSIIFQDPMTSLNPVYTIGNQIREVILLHTGKSKKEANERAKELLLREGSVTQVSLELGYESLTHFERVFRQIAGLSPTEWRKSQRPGEDKIS